MTTCPARTAPLCAFILAILLGACSDSAAPDSSAGRSASATDTAAARFVDGGSGSAKVTYQPNVRIVEREDVLASLMAVSTDGATLLFDPGTSSLQSLKTGDILMMKGIAARKVLATENDGSVIAVLTGPASLGEIIQDGRIRINAPFRFSATGAPVASTGSAPLLETLIDAAIPPAHADDAKTPSRDIAKDAMDLGIAAKKHGKKVVGLVKDGWNAKYSVTPSSGKLDISLVLTRDIGGFKGVITGKGYLADFDMSSDIEVKHGTVEKLETAFKRVNGLMNITWEVGKETPGGFSEESKIKLPGAITVPLYELLDGIPLYMEVSAAIIVQPFITGGQQYSHGAFRITYDGAQHFQAKEGNISPSGNVTGDIKFLEDRHISALAPVGMMVSLAAPRIELTLDPLKVLSDLQGDGSLQKAMKDAAEKADAYAEKLKLALRGTKAGDALKAASAALGDVSAGKMVESMKSNAMAYIQLVTTSAMTNSGMSVIAPCTHTALTMNLTVGASAQAFGQSFEPVSKVIFEKKLNRIDPPTVRLCDLKE